MGTTGQSRPCLGLVALLLATVSAGCSQPDDRDPSATFDLFVAEARTFSSGNTPGGTPAAWLELPCSTSRRGTGGTWHQGKGSAGQTLHLSFDCGDEDAIAGFLADLPAKIQARLDRVDVEWNPVTWEEGTFTLGYVDGPVTGSISGHMGMDQEGLRLLSLDIDEAHADA